MWTLLQQIDLLYLTMSYKFAMFKFLLKRELSLFDYILKWIHHNLKI